ncbi:MAG: hypothetical protein EA420_16395 [Candidatus Competibacteraceae bacterium]|nr:MAG: hypothetical protein EA420_16395 [Candidatus Competibacteraceae bacterium]
MTTEWQPIETAPQDGSKFIVTDGVRWISDARWPPGRCLGRWEWLTDDGKGYWGGGAFTMASEPTHWAPMLKMPDAAEKRYD